MKTDDVRKTVRERYGQRASGEGSCCSTTRSSRSCCGSANSSNAVDSPGTQSTKIGYSPQELDSIPEGADLGLGCGNPTALASLRPGEVVLDLGSGAGIDCFLASQAVGDTGRVIGVDMTAEMIDRARANARASEVDNVEFRLGEIEHLPVVDGSVDVIISNCVVNLSPDKPQVFGEAFRALKPGGRMFLSDIVLLKTLPDDIRESIEAYVGCVAGASMKQDYLAAIEAAGFRDVEILKDVSADSAFAGSSEAKIIVDGEEVDPESLGLDANKVHRLAGTIASITVRAFKPA